MTNDGGVYAKRDSVNVFTENNTFTDTVIVPNGYVLKGDNATSESNCGNIVVNACDLWAVFDSLNRRITALENAAPPVFNSISLSNPTIETLDVTADFTSEYIPITGYQFCYSQNSDMSESTCVPSTTNSITLTGLSSYTDYYVTASATNKVGTTTSTPVATKRTKAHNPMANIQTSPLAPNSISVTVNSLDFMEPGKGTVQLYYMKRTGSTCSTNIGDYTPLDVSDSLQTGDTYEETIPALDANSNYCIIAKVSHIDTTVIVGPVNAVSGGPNSLIITDNTGQNIGWDSLSKCKNYDAIITYTAVPEVGSADDYTYEWAMIGTGWGQILDTIDNRCVIKFTSVGTDKRGITCTAKKSTETITKTLSSAIKVRNANQVPTSVKSFSRDGLTLTLTATIPGNANYTAVDWGDGSDIVHNPQAGLQHTYATEGTYRVTQLQMASGSYDRYCPVTQSITVFPNPATTCAGTPHQSSEYTSSGLTSRDGYENGSVGAIDSVTDYDGNVYPVVEINGLCWMKENLRCTHSPSTGSSILNHNNLSGDNYFTTTTGKSAHWYQNNSTTYEPKHYGLLYNWCAAMDICKNDDEFNTSTDPWNPSQYEYLYLPHHRGICPKGWHIPTSEDWATLLSGNSIVSLVTGEDWTGVGGTCATCAGNISSTDRNSTYFSALAANYVSSGSNQTSTGFWRTSQNYSYISYSTDIVNNQYVHEGVFNTRTKPEDLVSIRCVRDTAGTPSAIPHEPGAIYLSVDNDHPSVQLCSSNGQNYPYASYHPVTVTYTAILSSDDPIADLTGYTITWSVSPATLNPTIDEVNRTCTVTYSSYPYSGDPQPQISCRATKEGEPDKVVTFFQAFSTPSNVIPDCNIITDTLSVYLRSRAASNNGTSNGISGNFTINWGDGSAVQVGPASSFTTGPEHTYTAAGSYTITLTNGSGCSATKEVTLTTAARFPCTGTAHTGAQYQNNGLNGTKNDGYEYTNGEGIVSVTDYDGNIYSVVQVGNQCWTRENMRCTHSPLTGTSIVNPLGASGNTFTMSKTSKVAQWYLNDQETSISKRYGLYYNWCAAMDTYYPGGNEVPQDGQSESYWSFSVTGNRRGICPKGWHIPSQSEFNELVSAAGSGTALSGSCDWNYCFGNEKDFYAVPAGEATLQFMNAGAMSDGYLYANFWSTKEYTNERVYPLRLTNPSSGESGFTSVSASTTYKTYYKDYGASVRCVRDAETGN